MSTVPPPPSLWVVDFSLVAVILVWAFTIVEDALNPAYDPPADVQRLCMIVAGFLCGARYLVRHGRNGGGSS